MLSSTGFNAVSLLYAVAGAFTAYRLIRERRSFLDGVMTREDVTLAWMVALFLLTPVAVLLHEAGHYFIARHFGADEVQLHLRGYWGFVTYRPGPTFDAGKEIIVAAAGPGVSVLLGYVSLALAAALPMRLAFKQTLAFFGMIGVFHALIGYPLIDLTSEIEGDFHSIYTLLSMPRRVVAGVIHGLLLGLLVLSWKRVGNEKGWVGPRPKKIVIVRRNQRTP